MANNNDNPAERTIREGYQNFFSELKAQIEKARTQLESNESFKGLSNEKKESAHKLVDELTEYAREGHSSEQAGYDAILEKLLKSLFKYKKIPLQCSGMRVFHTLFHYCENFQKEDRSKIYWRAFMAWLEERPSYRAWVYRGVKAKIYRLVPSVGRKYISPNTERSMFNQFKQKARLYENRELNDMEWLALAQHHGLSTRLMDWTYNPLVAAFFAVSGDKDKQKDARIYALDPPISTSSQSVKDPFTITKIQFIEPPLFTPRINLQKGLFSIHPIPWKSCNDCRLSIESVDCKNCSSDSEYDPFFRNRLFPKGKDPKNSFDIPSYAKAYFKSQIKLLGIDHLIFGDLEGVAKHIQKSPQLTFSDSTKNHLKGYNKEDYSALFNTYTSLPFEQWKAKSPFKNFFLAPSLEHSDEFISFNVDREPRPVLDDFITLNGNKILALYDKNYHCLEKLSIGFDYMYSDLRYFAEDNFSETLGSFCFLDPPVFRGFRSSSHSMPIEATFEFEDFISTPPPFEQMNSYGLLMKLDEFLSEFLKIFDSISHDTIQRIKDASFRKKIEEFENKIPEFRRLFQSYDKNLCELYDQYTQANKTNTP